MISAFEQELLSNGWVGEYKEINSSSNCRNRYKHPLKDYTVSYGLQDKGSPSALFWCRLNDGLTLEHPIVSSRAIEQYGVKELVAMITDNIIPIVDMNYTEFIELTNKQ